MTKPEFDNIDQGDKVEGVDWLGRALKGAVALKKKRSAVVIGGGSIGTYGYKRLTLVERGAKGKLEDKVRAFIEDVEPVL